MACGTPVVAATSGALPETVGDAALLVGPDDREGFADALIAAAFDDPVRRRLIAAGLNRASELTWERTAELTDGAIDQLLSSEPILDSAA
jgi:glycosyltransferase involved in cell wall biosynthesis